MGRAISKALTCGAAGALAWILCEPFFPKTMPLARTGPTQFDLVELWLTLLLGAFIGLAAGLFHGLQRGGMANIRMAIILGLVFGTMGSSFGHVIAGAIYVGMGGGVQSPGNMIARTISFIPWGAALGAGVGASQRSLRALKSGAFGGAVAGFITGAVFDPVSTLLGSIFLPVVQTNVPPGYVAEAGAPGRAIMTFGMGLLVGLFTALVDLATRRAWIRLVLGRNEGKEWPIDAVQTLIGRDERAHVPLFGDPSIPPLAAVIVKQGNAYILQDANSPIGVGHNGVRVQQAQLTSGDTIQIGSLNFQFMMKSGPGGAHEGRAKAIPVGGAPPGYSGPAQPAPYGGQAPYPHQPQPGAPSMPTQAMPQQPMPTQAYTQPVPQQTMAYPSAPVAPMAGGPVLVVTSGPLTGQRIPVDGPIDIGREATGLALAYDAQASRRHANVAPAAGGIQVTDLGSTNGTYVNGQRVPSAVLRPGDTLMIGSTSFRVE